MPFFNSDDRHGGALLGRAVNLRSLLVGVALVALTFTGGLRVAAASGPNAGGPQGAAGAGPRLALVIGNGDYRDLPKLIGAVSDADLMAETLTARGFKVVKATNVRRAVMVALLADFEQTLVSQGGVGVFYFSGQAVHAAGEEIMFPIEARATGSLSLLKEDGISLSQVQRDLPARTARPWRDNGIVTIYATSKGQVAFDSLPGQKNSPFAIAFVNAVKQPGDVPEVFQRVRQSVEEAFRDPRAQGFKQTPDISGQLREGFFFNQAARDPVGSVSRILLLDTSRDTVSSGGLTR
jgi:hypothetical protein